MAKVSPPPQLSPVILRRRNPTGRGVFHSDSSAKSDQVLFFKDVDKQVLLISLKAGGLGLNLTAASNVFLLDTWWPPAMEEEAIMEAMPHSYFMLRRLATFPCGAVPVTDHQIFPIVPLMMLPKKYLSVRVFFSLGRCGSNRYWICIGDWKGFKRVDTYIPLRSQSEPKARRTSVSFLFSLKFGSLGKSTLILVIEIDLDEKVESFMSLGFVNWHTSYWKLIWGSFSSFHFWRITWRRCWLYHRWMSSSDSTL